MQPIHAEGAPVYAVRDWLDFHLIRWPIFNLADSFLVCGAALLIWHAFRSESHSGSERATRDLSPLGPGRAGQFVGRAAEFSARERFTPPRAIPRSGLPR